MERHVRSLAAIIAAGNQSGGTVDKSNKSLLNRSVPRRYEKLLQGKSFTCADASYTTPCDVLKWSISETRELFGIISDIIAEMTRIQDDIAPSPVI